MQEGEGDDIAFVRAAREGKLEEINKLVAKGVDVNVCVEKNDNTKTALYVACKHGHEAVVDRLLALGADWNIGRDSVVPLLVACQYGHLPVVQKLVAAGSPLAICDEEGRGPLHFAAWGGRKAPRGADADADADAVVRWLVDTQDEDVCECDDSGRAPVCYAAESDNLEVLDFLEKKGGCADVEPAQLLTCAVRGEAVRVIRYLGERKVKISEDDEFLHEAAQHHPKIIEELIRVGLVDAKRANKRDEDGNTPLHVMFSENEFSDDTLVAVRALVRAGADVNAKDELDKTVFSKWVYGAMYNRDILVKGLTELQKLGADVNQGGALHFSLEAKEMDLFFSLLRDYGADINAKYEGQTVLHLAALHGEDDLVDILVDEGASLNEEDEDGNTPADLASKGGHMNTYNMLSTLTECY